MTIWDMIGCAAIAAPAALCLCLSLAGALDGRSDTDRGRGDDHR